MRGELVTGGWCSTTVSRILNSGGSEWNTGASESLRPVEAAGKSG